MISKLSLPMAMVGTLLTAAVGAGAVYAATVAKVEQVTQAQAQTRDEVRRLQEQRENLTLELSEVKTELKQIARTLERIDRRLTPRD